MNLLTERLKKQDKYAGLIPSPNLRQRLKYYGGENSHS